MENISQYNRFPGQAVIISRDIRCPVRTLIQAVTELVQVSRRVASQQCR
jgi:hypothetical protein